MSVLILDREYEELLNLRRKNRKNKKLQEKCKWLTNNWNDLEKWLIDYIKLFDNPDILEEQTKEDLQEVLDKMKEIKEGKK